MQRAVEQDLFVGYKGDVIELWAPCDDHITSEITRTATFYEAELLDFLFDLAQTGTFVDVGAHIGNHTVAFARCFPQCTRVVAFEPNPASFRLLSRNCERAGVKHKVELHRMAVHDAWHSGSLIFCDGNSGHTQLVRGGAVRVCRLRAESFADEVSLIKVDVEGHELAVLRSARALLERDLPVVVAEAQTGAHRRGVAELLGRYGYEELGCFNATPTYVFAVT